MHLWRPRCLIRRCRIHTTRRTFPTGRATGFLSRYPFSCRGSSVAPQPAPPIDVQPPLLFPRRLPDFFVVDAAEEDYLYDIAIARLERLRAVGGISEQEYSIGRSNLNEKCLGVSLSKKSKCGSKNKEQKACCTIAISFLRLLQEH